MTSTIPLEGFTAGQIAEMLGISRQQVTAMVRDGLLHPREEPGEQRRFSFRDVALLRTAKDLKAQGVPPRRLRQALLTLKERLPDGGSLSQVAIEAAGSRVVVRDADGVFEAESGQAELELRPRGEAADDAGATPGDRSVLVALQRGDEPAALPDVSIEEVEAGLGDPPAGDPDELYNFGIDLEAVSAEQAREAYERALQLRPDHADARANLGRLLHERGDLAEAERQYRIALEAEPENVTAAFNLGVALEDLGRTEEALDAYQRALTSDPAYAPAHFNLARLHEREGRRDAALRHLVDYRRATRE